MSGASTVIRCSIASAILARRVRKALALEDFREQAGDGGSEPDADDPHRLDATGGSALERLGGSGRGEPARLAARGGLASLCGQLDLAESDVGRRHLDALVLADVLERLVERERVVAG